MFMPWERHGVITKSGKRADTERRGEERRTGARAVPVVSRDEAR